MSVVDVNDNGKWYTDQLITTHALISSKTCNVPKTSGLWNMKGTTIFARYVLVWCVLINISNFN